MEYSDTIAYKTWLENLDEPAPEGAWDTIADQLDIDAAWDSISETLDLDDVWQNIEPQLPQAVSVTTSDTTTFPKVFWLAAAIALFTLTTPLSEQTDFQNKEEVKHASETVTEKLGEENAIQRNDISQSGERVILRNRSNKVPSLTLSTGEDSSYSKRFSDFTRVADTLSDSKLTDQFSQASSKDEQLTPGDSIKPSIKPDSLLIAVLDNRDSVEQKEEQIGRAKWQVGVIGSVKNTWLINPETTNGLKRSSLNATRLTFGKEFGVTVQRSFGNQAALQIEYYFYSEIGQRYHEYINALYQTKDVRLRYQKIQFLYRTRIFRKISAPSLYAVGGIRVSRLTLADTSIGGEDNVVTQEYRPWDYGFIIGSEAEFELGERFLIVSGIRGSYGVRNIYLGNTQTPGEFNKTHTASVGISVGLKYKIN